MAIEAKFLLTHCLAPPFRRMGVWAEEEVEIPSGPYEGQKYRLSRKPASRLWFDALDSRKWRRHVVTGPSQSGKSLECFVIPTLYCLFELREDVICGVPQRRMAARKWADDLLPVIVRSRYRDLLPSQGAGSRGGEVDEVRFRNGATLKFMSGGGDDKSRAGDTAPNLVVTETDGLDTPSSTSREADPLKQMEARTLSFDDGARIILECTVSTEEGRTWQEYQGSTCSKIVRPCPKCGEWVTPEREHFVGWEDARDEIEAGDLAAFSCPSCGEFWTDEERFAANDACRLIHRGQRINRDGLVSGDEPQTRTLGFRWSVVDNPFRSSRMLGQLEWKAVRAKNPENAEKELLQFQYAMPFKPPEVDEVHLDADVLAERFGLDRTRRGIVPEGFELITVGVDVGGKRLHYVVIAWRFDGTCRIVDYGELSVYSAKLGAERAILAALQYLRDEVLARGYPGPREEARPPDQVWIDAGWKPEAVHRFCQESQRLDDWRGVFRACVGRGKGRQYGGSYSAPKGKDKKTLYVGDGFFFSLTAPGRVLAILDADHWKSFVHQRLATASDQPGAMTLFVPSDKDHKALCRHLTAEKEAREFVEGVGEVKVWIAVSRTNHYLDAVAYSAAGAGFAGVDLITGGVQDAPTDNEPKISAPRIETPDGRNFWTT